MHYYLYLTLLICCLACNETNTGRIDCKNKVDYSYKTTIHNHSANTIPLFFNALVNQHIKELKIIDSVAFLAFCKTYQLNSEDTFNQKSYYTIGLLHRIFTSNSAKNGSRGEIINIPYYWHWVSPNPRYKIKSLETSKLLNSIPSTKEYPKYKSFADIDRTPYLFLSDLLSEKPKYYSELADTFSTFGWCSEREMAFVCLLNMMGYKGKVIAENNHSWSEFIIPLRNKNSDSSFFKVKVDNTFDLVYWNQIDTHEFTEWNRYQGTSKLANWYNLQAHSQKQKEQINSFPISKIAMQRMEKSLVDYLNFVINDG